MIIKGNSIKYRYTVKLLYYKNAVSLLLIMQRAKGLTVTGYRTMGLTEEKTKVRNLGLGLWLRVR